MMSLTGAIFLTACAPHHHHAVKPKQVNVVKSVKHVVVVKPVKVKHAAKWHHWQR